MLPRPQATARITLHKLPVLPLRVDEGDIARVCLGLLVQQRKDAVRTGKSHHNRVELLAHLVDRHVKALVKCQKACQRPERKIKTAGKGEYAAHHRTQHIAHVAELRVDRP